MKHQAGWYGKLPALGDFAGRRLPGEFVARWDGWLQRGMARSRGDLGERWMDLYLTFPVWRFMVPAEAAGQFAWCGVLLPSVDRVGRCFPLTICRRLDRDEAEQAGFAGIEAGLTHLAEAGLQALDGIAPEAFDAALDASAQSEANAPAAVASTASAGSTGSTGSTSSTSSASSASAAKSASAAPPAVALPALLPGGSGGVWPLHVALAGALARAAELGVLANLADRSLWWTPHSEDRPGVLRSEPNPPGDDLLTHLIRVD